jgi:hypothetical protein
MSDSDGVVRGLQMALSIVRQVAAERGKHVAGGSTAHLVGYERAVVAITAKIEDAIKGQQ